MISHVRHQENQSYASQVMHEDMLTMWCSMGIVDGCDVCRSGYMYVLMGVSENVSVVSCEMSCEMRCVR